MEGDLAQLRFRALVQESLHPRLHRLQRAVQIGAEDDPGNPLRRFGLNPFVDRLEQARLVSELVVEGAAGNSGGAHDLLGADVLVAPLGEERAGGGDQGLTSGLRALGLSSAGFWIYIHAVCILEATIDQRSAS
jgi:hypothetical protein